MDVESGIPSLALPDLSHWFLAVINWLLDLLPVIGSVLKDILGVLIGLSFPLSFFFLIGIVYCVENIKQIRKKEEKIYDTKTQLGYEDVKGGDVAMARRWDAVTKHMASDNPNDWKQAIIEADIILDDLLNKLGYKGESVGDKLKRVVKGDMKTLDDAWEAHKVRNQIAHDGSTFSLNQVEATNTIASYRRVFEEFYYL